MLDQHEIEDMIQEMKKKKYIIVHDHRFTINRRQEIEVIIVIASSVDEAEKIFLEKADYEDEYETYEIFDSGDVPVYIGD